MIVTTKAHCFNLSCPVDHAPSGRQILIINIHLTMPVAEEEEM